MADEIVPISHYAPPTDAKYGSPEWWLYDLEAELDRRYPLVSLYEDYYQGRHKLTFATPQYREAFGQMLTAVADNWIPMIIDAWVERLRPQGFIFPNGEEGGERSGDEDAWRMWQASGLDAHVPLGFTEAGKHGESYLLVWPDDRPSPKGVFGRFFSRGTRESLPRITLEHPSQVVVRRAAGDRTRRAAALKRWMEDDGSYRATLYLPDKTYRFERNSDKREWSPRIDVEAESPNRIGVVPVIPLVNDPQMLPAPPPTALSVLPHGVPTNATVGLGRSDQADIITTVDQINKLICDMLIASEFAGFRQRWMTGIETPIDPTTGEPVEAWRTSVSRILETPNENAKFGEFGATDLSNYWKAIESRIKSLAARTRTPPHYILGEIVQASGDALKAAETGLASKATGKQGGYGESLEEAIRVGFAWMGDPRAGIQDAEVVWGPAESRSESEYVDSLVKKLSLGVPKEQLWKDAGYSPQQIGQFKAMLLEEAATFGVFDLGAPPEPDPEPTDAREPALQAAD